MKHSNTSAAAMEHVAPAQTTATAPDWKRLAAQLRTLDQRIGMSADVPEAATGQHFRALICLEDAATGEAVALPPRLHHRLRLGAPERACLELLVPATERGRGFVRGLRLTWSGRRAAETAPLWEAMNVEVRGRGTLEAAAGVLANWARAFPEAIVSVRESGAEDQEAGQPAE